MPLRPLPENCHNVKSENKVMAAKPELAITRTAGKAKFYRDHGLPTLWYLSGPPQPGQLAHRMPYFRLCQGLVAYSEEHKKLWTPPIPDLPHDFPPIYVCRYPIDTEAFKGYRGDIAKALMIATMPMHYWARIPGDWKGPWLLKICLSEGIPYQLIGFDNDYPIWEDATPRAITSEAEMVECLASHRVYGHTGTFLCRSPLEALAVGAPVVIRQTGASHYMTELPHGEGVERVPDAPGRFMEAIRYYLAHPYAAVEMGQRGRERIAEFFSPDVVKKQWTRAFEGALSWSSQAKE